MKRCACVKTLQINPEFDCSSAPGSEEHGRKRLDVGYKRSGCWKDICAAGQDAQPVAKLVVNECVGNNLILNFF